MKKNEKRIEATHLSKQFHKKAVLEEINLLIQAGEIFGFLGPSGAGKTTAIKLLTGQLSPTSGQASILGVDINKLNNVIYHQIGIVTDNSNLYEKLTVEQNLTFFADLLQVDRKEIDQVLEKVNLQLEKKKIVAKLSKGMRQRLNLARAIIHHPKILFLDEPTSNLDPINATMIHKLLLELREQGITIFLTTHNMTEANKLCDQIALLNKGKIIVQGTPNELRLQINHQKKYHVVLTDHTEQWLEQTDKNINQIHTWMIRNQLESIHSSEPTLEQAFLTMTGGNTK